MTVNFEATWGSVKPKLLGERRNLLTRNSEFMVTARTDELGLFSVHIEIHGALQAIPSLKNGRTFGGIPPETRAKLQAMDELFKAELVKQGIQRLTFLDTPVHMAVWFGRRANFDEDNARTTLKDWLEPPRKIVGRKEKKNRGWGIGLVNNDKRVKDYSLMWSDVGLECDYTLIKVTRWDDVRPAALSFAATLMAN